jgi:hypothetical protein
VTDINPPPITPPAEWFYNPRLSKDVQDLYYFLYQLWRKTQEDGEQIDINISNIDDALNGWATEYYGEDDFQAAFEELVVSENFETSGNQILKLSKDVKITLNPNPKDKERVYVKSTGKPFTAFSTRKIDGQQEIRYTKPYVGRWFSYSIELDTWSIL